MFKLHLPVEFRHRHIGKYAHLPYLRSMGEFSFQDAMDKFIKSSRLKNGIQAVRIEELWGELMGKTISKYTEKIQIIGTTLYITTSVAPLKNELLYQKVQIVDRINEALGADTVKEVVIK